MGDMAVPAGARPAIAGGADAARFPPRGVVERALFRGMTGLFRAVGPAVVPVLRDGGS